MCRAWASSSDGNSPLIGSVAGPIGNNTNEGTANHRLLKCIASSSQGTLDHYHFAETEDDLQAIFTKIANQIAHRLIE